MTEMPRHRLLPSEVERPCGGGDDLARPRQFRVVARGFLELLLTALLVEGLDPVDLQRLHIVHEDDRADVLRLEHHLAAEIVREDFLLRGEIVAVQSGKRRIRRPFARIVQHNRAGGAAANDRDHE